MRKHDEPELIARALSEDHEAYGELVDRYKNALYRHCFAIVRNENAAEDIAQESFIVAYYKLDQYNSDYKFSTWLFKIATNKALNWLKKHAKEIAADDAMIAKIASTQPSPRQAAEDIELHEAVDRLEPKYRTVISLYYWQGLSYQEIANVLAVPEGSVKGWLNRAKYKLRKELA